MDDGEVAEWLHRALWWQDHKDVKCLLDQQHWLTELVAFLQRLLTKLRQLGSVEDVLHTLPQVGQLLGRLSSLPLLLTSESCYKTLMSCILFFSVPQPQSAIEGKAKQWALSQLRNTVCYSQQEFSSVTLDVTGVTQCAFNELHLQEVAAQLTSHLESSASSQLLSDHVTTQDSYCHLEDICKLCAHLRHIPAFSRVLDSAMLHMWKSASRRSEWEGCLTEMMHSQNRAYIDEALPPLPYTTQRLLWQLKLESLEQEVLLLVEAITVRPFLTKHPVLELIKCRHLVKAAVEHFDIYEAVFSMLRELHQHSQGANTVAFVIGSLHECVREEFDSSQHDPPLSVLPHYSQRLQSLVTRLLVNPRDLDTDSVEAQMRQIAQQLHNVCEMSREEIHTVLLQFPAWYHIALFLTLTGSKSVSQSCIDIVMTFKWNSVCSPLQEFHHLQRSVEETVSSLRGLFNKSSLLSDDLTCAIATNENSCCNNVTTDLIGQLLMLFLMFSSGGHLIYKTILPMATGELDDAGHLECFLDTLQVVTSSLPPWLLKPCVVVPRFRKIVDLLLSEASTDVPRTTVHETESPKAHCSYSQPEVEHINRPMMSEQNVKPTAVYQEQWKELVIYLEEIT